MGCGAVWRAARPAAASNGPIKPAHRAHGSGFPRSGGRGGGRGKMSGWVTPPTKPSEESTGGPEPRFSSPMPLRICPERGKPLPWPYVHAPPAQACARSQKMPKTDPAMRMARGMLNGPCKPRGPWLSRTDDAFPCAAWEPTITRMHPAVVTLQPSRLCSPDNQTARQVCPWDRIDVLHAPQRGS